MLWFIKGILQSATEIGISLDIFLFYSFFFSILGALLFGYVAKFNFCLVAALWCYAD